MSKIIRANHSLTEREERFYKRHKKLIDAMISACSSINNAFEDPPSNIKIAYQTLENAIGKEFMRKLIAKRYWEAAERASQEVAKWPAWKRGERQVER